MMENKAQISKIFVFICIVRLIAITIYPYSINRILIVTVYTNIKILMTPQIE